MQVETDIVLSAIRRGEDSLPKLRAATGLDYAKLHPILHELEFEGKSIQRSETADGFDRYAPMPSGRVDAFKGTHWKEETVHTIPPAALNRTKVAEAARELALLQRNAPYCVVCRGLCVLHGTDRTGKIRWRCRACDLTFVGSGTVRDLNRIAPEKREAAISAFNEAKSVRVVAREVGISHQTAEKIRREEKIEAQCPCGKDAKHKGWCSYRFQNSPARQATVEKMNMGQDRVDSPKNCEQCGKSLEGQKRVNMNRCSECWSLYLKGHAERRKAKAPQNGHAQKSGENITETITAVAEKSDSVETQKQAMAQVSQNGAKDYRPRFLDDGRLMQSAAEDYRETEQRARKEIERLLNLVNLFDACSHWCPPPALPRPTQMLESVKLIDRRLKRMEAYVEQEKR